jgi:hypothetical protein
VSNFGTQLLELTDAKQEPIKQNGEKQMRRIYRFVILAGGLTLLVGSIILIAGALNLGEADAQAECTLQTLNGTYLFQGAGVFVDGEGADATLVHYTEAGHQIYDGEGNFEGVYSSRVNGEFLDNMVAFTGTYRT